MQNPAQQFEQELRKELEATVFPESFLPPTFPSMLDDALVNKSMATLGCDVKTLGELINFNLSEGVSCYVAGVAINAIQASTPQELQVGLNDYLTVQRQVQTMADEWNKIVGPIKTSVMRKLSVQNNLTKGAPKMAIGKA